MDFNKQIQKMWDDMSDRGQKDLVRNAVRVFVADKMGSFLLKEIKKVTPDLVKTAVNASLENTWVNPSGYRRSVNAEIDGVIRQAAKEAVVYTLGRMHVEVGVNLNQPEKKE